MSKDAVERYTSQGAGSAPRDILVTVTESFVSPYNKSPLKFGKLQDGRDVALKFPTTGLARNEYVGLELLHSNGVRVPEPIAFVERVEEPTSGIVMEKLEGRTLDEVTTPENRFLLGREVRKMHMIGVLGFGLIDQGTPQFQQGADYVESVMAEITPHLQGDRESAHLLSELWGELKAQAIQPKFIHRDVKDKNVIVEPAGRVALFDLEYWNGGDAMWDVGGYLFYTLRTQKPEAEFREFLQGYTDGQESADPQKTDILFYSLLSAGRLVELVSRVDPNNIDYANKSMSKVAAFVKGKRD